MPQEKALERLGQLGRLGSKKDWEGFGVLFCVFGSVELCCGACSMANAASMNQLAHAKRLSVTEQGVGFEPHK